MKYPSRLLVWIVSTPEQVSQHKKLHVVMGITSVLLGGMRLAIDRPQGWADITSIVGGIGILALGTSGYLSAGNARAAAAFRVVGSVVLWAAILIFVAAAAARLRLR